jgi:hypothetical protein
VLQLWLPALAAARQQLHLLQLVSSGEMLPVSLAKELLHALPDSCLLLNLYGKQLISLSFSLSGAHCLLVTQYNAAGRCCANITCQIAQPLTATAVGCMLLSNDAHCPATAARVN